MKLSLFFICLSLLRRVLLYYLQRQPSPAQCTEQQGQGCRLTHLPVTVTLVRAEQRKSRRFRICWARNQRAQKRKLISHGGCFPLVRATIVTSMNPPAPLYLLNRPVWFRVALFRGLINCRGSCWRCFGAASMDHFRNGRDVGGGRGV